MNAGTTVLVLGILLLFASLIIGIIFIIKYFRTRNKAYLWVGLGLTLVVLGIVVYAIYKIFFRPVVTCYMVALPPNATGSVAFILYRKDLIKRMQDSLPKHVLKKISRKKD